MEPATAHDEPRNRTYRMEVWSQSVKPSEGSVLTMLSMT